MCKVSIILPSLNVADYIEECICSVLHQTLKELEIICVDAGSTDGTLECIKKYTENDPRIKLILSDRKSYGFQMNLGISNAIGEYIGIVETDDFVPINMFEDLYQIAIRENAEIVKADFYRFRTQDNQLKCSYNALDPSRKYYNKVLNPAENQEIFRFVMNTWSGIYSREFLKKNHILHHESPGASYQDNGFWFQTFCCAERVFFVGQPYYMNRRDNIHSSVNSTEKVYCMTEEWDYIYRWLEKSKDKIKTFIGVYTLRKFHSMLFTYHRIGPRFQEEYVQHMSSEMKKHFQNNEYRRDAFTHLEWKQLQLILRAPEAFYLCTQNNCHYVAAARMIQKSNNRFFIRILRRADALTYMLESFFSWISHDGLLGTINRCYYKNKTVLFRKEKLYD